MKDKWVMAGYSVLRAWAAERVLATRTQASFWSFWSGKCRPTFEVEGQREIAGRTNWTKITTTECWKVDRRNRLEHTGVARE